MALPSLLSRPRPRSHLLSSQSLSQLLSLLTTHYLRHRTAISRTVYLTLLLALINRIRNAIAEQKAASLHQAQVRLRPGTIAASSSSADDDDDAAGAGTKVAGVARGVAAAAAAAAAGKRKRVVGLNREFAKNLLRLLRVVIPGWRSPECRLVVSHSGFLVVRTLISLYVAELDGKLVRWLVRGQGRRFLLGIVWWMVVAVPATFTNSMVSAAKLFRGGKTWLRGCGV